MSKLEYVHLRPRPQLYTLPNGRVCYHYGPASQFWGHEGKHKVSNTVNSPAHITVMIPLTASERRNSQKRAHFQTVRVSNLKPVQEKRLVLS